MCSQTLLVGPGIHRRSLHSAQSRLSDLHCGLLLDRQGGQGPARKGPLTVELPIHILGTSAIRGPPPNCCRRAGNDQQGHRIQSSTRRTSSKQVLNGQLDSINQPENLEVVSAVLQLDQSNYPEPPLNICCANQEDKRGLDQYHCVLPGRNPTIPELAESANPSKTILGGRISECRLGRIRLSHCRLQLPVIASVPLGSS